MNTAKPTRFCLVPRLGGVGGMVSFQAKLAKGLANHGIQTTFDLNDPLCQSVLVIGGTRHLAQLWRVKRRGLRIIQRLDGMNWIHRRLKTGLRHYLKAEYGNWLLAATRNRLAHGVIYQSHFAQQWWQDQRGIAPVPSLVIYNGVDLKVYRPDEGTTPPDSCYRLLLVEGSLQGGYEHGLENAARLAVALNELIQTAHRYDNHRSIELIIAGRVTAEIRQHWDAWMHNQQPDGHVKITWAGLIPANKIPEIDRSAHVLFSADLNAACPNAVIESLACGTPVVSFATGALPELLEGGGGLTVPYGGDPWHLDPPDIQSLAQATWEIIQDQARYRQAARQRAEQAFSLEHMVSAYLDVLLG